MNQINPQKLLRSKWTMVKPVNKEKHFIVSDIEFDEQGALISCYIEAVISKRSFLICWQDLKDERFWLQGWK